jgi:prepilin-type processing-associated H-X9-DG protein
VVISIIALLVGILLPALASARKSAELLQCRSNVRQQLIALNAFIVDNGDRLPLAKNFDWQKFAYKELTFAPYIQDEMILYLGGQLGSANATPSNVAFSKVFRCPASEKYPGEPWLADPNTNHYWYNAHYAIDHENQVGRLVSEVRVPTEAVVFYDIVFANWPAEIFPHHSAGSGINVGYVDGHASSMSAEDYLAKSPDSAYEDEGKNPFVKDGWE